MQVGIDTHVLGRSLRDLDQRFEVLIESVDPHGRAEVVTSKRTKMPHERANRRQGRRATKAPAGHHIANFLRAKGRDPFDLLDEDWNEVEEFLTGEMETIFVRAFRTRRPQRQAIKQVLIAAATHLAEAAQEHIRSGGLGRNTRGQIRKKLRYVAKGWTMRGQGGRVPPYGILTGRFVAGIRCRWRQGYRPRGR